MRIRHAARHATQLVAAVLALHLVACGGAQDGPHGGPGRAADATSDAPSDAAPPACTPVDRRACDGGRAFSCPVRDGTLAATPPADAGTCHALFDGTTVPVTAETFCCT